MPGSTPAPQTCRSLSSLRRGDLCGLMPILALRPPSRLVVSSPARRCPPCLQGLPGAGGGGWEPRRASDPEGLPVSYPLPIFQVGFCSRHPRGAPSPLPS